MESTFIDNISSTEQLKELEDVNLTTHIDEVRNLLKTYNASVNEDPLLVINNDKELRIMISELILELKQQQNDLRIISDNLYITSSHSTQLSNGNKPYVYRECHYASDIFKEMSSEFELLHLKTEEVLLLSENIEKKLIQLRRLYESIIKNTCDYV